MKILRNMVLSAMTGGSTGNATPLLIILYVLSKLYGFGVRLRSALYDSRIVRQKKLPCRVISIGNLSVGGTGKTPMTIFVAKMLQDSGLKPVVISRGYKGGLEKKGGIVSDGKTVFAESGAAGDEPLMMARTLKGIPVMVGRNRFDAGIRAVKDFKADVIVLDDGFQHRRLYRDLDLVMIDDKTFLGNGQLIPRGILREPPSGLARSHACVLTRSMENSTGHFEKLQYMLPGKEVFRAFHVPYIYGILPGRNGSFPELLPPNNMNDFSLLKNASVFIFSGIAKNLEFREMVKEKVKAVVGFKEFPDHHFYAHYDIEDIVRLSGKFRADFIITTEKDFSRLSFQFQCPIGLAVIGVRVSFGKNEERFCRFIHQHIQ